MDKLLQRSNGEINIELFDNNFKKFFQSGCCKILNPNNYNESNELVINNYENGSDQLIVLDVRNGDLLSEANVNSKLANGMFLTPGNNRDIFYCSTGAFSRISWS